MGDETPTSEDETSAEVESSTTAPEDQPADPAPRSQPPTVGAVPDSVVFIQPPPVD